MARNHLPVVMILGAQSTHDALASVPKEVSSLKEIIVAYPHETPNFHLEYEPFLTNEYLTNRLDQFKNNIAVLHFAGHSNAQGLVSNDSVVYARHLAEIFSRWTSPPGLIFLNGCQNAEQVDVFHAAGVGVVIATYRPIGDQQASCFAQEFYHSLFANKRTDLQTAFADAGAKVLLPDDRQVRSLDIETLPAVEGSEWDWGLFAKQPEYSAATFTRLISEGRPRYDEQGELLNPYRGLQAFREEDRAYFFGREALTTELCDRLPATPLFVLLGASGSGKSSLISAGVIPGLPDKKTWLVLQTRPGNAPFSELALGLAEYFYPEPQQAVQRLQKKTELEGVLAGQQIQLADLLPELLKDSDKSRLLLVIDQFEELFTQSEIPTAQSFLLLLTQLAAARPEHCHLVLVMRADFLSAALAHPGLAHLLDEHPPKLLAPMGKAELRAAIEKPAAKQRIEVESSLTEALLDAVEHQAGSLPLLQHVLSLLWEQRTDHRIRLEDYTQLGGLEKALEKRADAIFEAFSPSEQAHCQSIFLRLIQPGDGTEDTRRRAMLDEFGDDAEVLRVVKTLADTRLITTQQDDEDGLAYAEVSHEALIRHWRRLREWIAENRVALRTQVQVARGAKDWQEHQQQKDWLLSGSRLTVAEEWLAEHGGRAADTEARFIAASVRQREYRRKRNRKVVLGVVASLAMIALLAVWQWFNANQAEHRAKEQLLEANYNLAKAFEEKASSTFDKSMELELGDPKRDEYRRHALLYAFEAQRKPIPKDKTLSTLEVSNLLSRVDARWLMPERKQTPTLNLRANMNTIAYHPDGKFIASGGDDGTVYLWGAESGEAVKTLKGLGPVSSVVYSPNGKLIASTDSYDVIVRLWDVESGETVQTLEGHSGEIFSVAYSPDGKFIVSGAWDKTVRVWDVESGETVQTLEGHSGEIFSVAYSPDGKFIVSGAKDKTVRVWEIASGKTVKILKGHSKEVRSVAYSPDGKSIISGGQDQMVRVWDSESGKIIRILQGHSGTINTLAYSPDGKFITSGAWDQTVRVWDTASGENIKTLKGHSDNVSSVAYSPDGKFIASSGEFGAWDQTVRVWNAESGENINSPKGYNGRILSVAYSPNGKFIASGADDEIVRVWGAESGKIIKILKGHSGAINTVAYSPNGKFIASGADDKTVRVWDAESGGIIKILQGHSGTINTVAYSPDGKFIASGADDKTVRVWDAESGEIVRTLEGHSRAINTVAYSPDGKFVASGAWDHTVRVWDSKSGKTVKTLEGHSLVVHTLAYSPNGKFIAFGSRDKTLRVWDAESGDAVKILGSLRGSILSVAYSLDGKFIISGAGDDTVRVWDAESGEIIKTLQGHSGAINTVAYSPNGKFIASGADDQTMRLWDAESRRTVKILKDHDGVFESAGIGSVAYSPAGKFITSGAGDSTVRVWKAESGKTIKVLKGHTDRISSVAYSPDGKFIASGSRDKTLRVWEAESGKTIKVLKGHTDRISSVAYSPDGKFIASGAGDATVHVWEVESGKTFNVLKGHTGAISSVAYSPDGKFIASGSWDETVRVWSVESGENIKTLKGHNEMVFSVAYSPDGKFIVSGGHEDAVRLWDVESGQTVKALKGYILSINSVSYSPDGKFIAFSTNEDIVRVNTQSWETVNIIKNHIGGISSIAYSSDGKFIASGGHDNTVRLWGAEKPYPLFRLLYEFDPVEVADALEFLWNLRLEELRFLPNYPTPALFPHNGYYITWNEHTEKFRPLLDAPRPDETKMDQLVRWLEERKAYRKTPAGAPAE